MPAEAAEAFLKCREKIAATVASERGPFIATGSTSGFAAKIGAADTSELGDKGHRSENVAFDAYSCATVPISSEGGPAKWLKNKTGAAAISTAPRDRRSRRPRAFSSG